MNTRLLLNISHSRNCHWLSLLTLIQKLATVKARDTASQIKNCDALLVCQDTDRGYLFNKKAYSQILDSLGEKINKDGLKTQSLSGSFSILNGERAYGNPLTINRFLLKNILYSKILNIVLGDLRGELWLQDQKKSNWQKILKNCNAKIVFAIQPEIALCRAGHELGIRIFDVQHGVISDSADNPYYYGKNLLTMEIDDLPHGYLCWNDSSATVLEPMRLKKEFSVHVIGNPWLDRFAEPEKNDQLVQAELLMSHKIEQPSILVTLQHSMYENASDYVSNGVMAISLENVIKKTCDKFFWYIRLHPAQNVDVGFTKNYLHDTFGHLPNIDWNISSRMALPVILQRLNLHITHFSAATIEAACMGIKTGLLDPHIRFGGKHADLYSFEISQGYAKVIELNEISIISFIVSSLKSPTSKLSEDKKIPILSLFNTN